ncbi:MAG: HEAT repeat domain-containing protein [Anaerolineales bacterium]|nr:HEAT repeat domain-containing protein [Anaerolineales bacterium]
MNTHLTPYADIIEALCQWAESHNADSLKYENLPEILTLSKHDVSQISKVMSAILSFAETDIRLYVINALPHLVPSDVMIDLLLPYLSDSSSGIRWTLCELFHGYPDSRVVLPLVKVLQNDADPNVRLVAAEALYAVGDERAIPALAYAEKYDKGKDYEDRTIANAAHEAIAAIKKRMKSKC